MNGKEPSYINFFQIYLQLDWTLHLNKKKKIFYPIRKISDLLKSLICKQDATPSRNGCGGVQLLVSNKIT